MTADLVASRLDGPSSVSPGDRVQLTFDMENQGTSNARLWNYSLSIEDLNGNSVHHLATSTVPDLRPNTWIGRNLSVRVNIPSGIANGQYNFVLTVDSGGGVREISEQNNRATDAFTMGGGTGGGGGGGNSGGGNGACQYSDFNDSISEALDLGAIADSATQSGYTISDGCDVDMFSFSVRANQRLGIDLDVPVGLNSYLRLFNSTGEELDRDGFGSAPDETFEVNRAGREAYIEHTFREAGTYYVGVSADGNENYSSTTGGADQKADSTGNFSLSIKHVRDVVAPAENGSLSGTLFQDVNGDGEWNQATESVLSGWQVYLDSNQNGRGDSSETFVTTDSDGRYTFDSMTAGAHQIVVSAVGYSQTTTPVLKKSADYRLLAVRDRVQGEADLVELGQSGQAEIVHQSTWTGPMDIDPISGDLVFATNLLRELDLETGQRSTAGRIHDVDGNNIFVDDFAVSPDGLLYGVVFDTTSTLYNLKPDGNDWLAERVAGLGRNFDGVVQGAIEFDASGTFYATNGSFADANGRIVVEAALFEIHPVTGATIRTIGDLDSLVYDLESTPDGGLLALTTSTEGSSTIAEVSMETADVLFEEEFPFWIRDFTAEVTDYEVANDGGGWAMVIRNGEDVTDWNVGFERAVVSPPARTVIHTPHNTDSRRPELTWNAVDGAEFYELWVTDSTASERVIHRTSLTETSFTPETDLEQHTHRVWVRSGNSAGWGPWSRSVEFDLSTGSEPERPVITGASGGTDTGRPILTWAVTNGADSYELWVNDLETGQRVLNQHRLTSASFQSPTVWEEGRYRVWVRAWNQRGAGQWSAAEDFTVGAASPLPGRGTVLGPGDTSVRSPLFSWAALANADRYELWVTHVETGRIVLHDNNLTSTSATFSNSLPTGMFRVWIRGGNSAGWGLWSSAHVFNIS